VATIISLGFVAGLIASAIAGAVIFMAAAMRLLRAVGAAAIELSLSPAALANGAGEDFSHPRARFN
jgi:hypothetical protein